MRNKTIFNQQAKRDLFRMIAKVQDEDRRELLTQHATTFLNCDQFDSFHSQQITLLYTYETSIKSGAIFLETLRVAWGRKPEKMPGGGFLYPS
jgi:hypothetical protein